MPAGSKLFCSCGRFVVRRDGIVRNDFVARFLLLGLEFLLPALQVYSMSLFRGHRGLLIIIRIIKRYLQAKLLNWNASRNSASLNFKDTWSCDPIKLHNEGVF